MNGDDIERIVKHMRTTAYLREDGKKFLNQFPLLAEALSARCAPDPTLGTGKYRPLACQLPALADELNLASPVNPDAADIETTTERVEQARKDMQRGSYSSLAPAMILWLWRHHEIYARSFVERLGYNLQAKQAESLANVQSIGTAAHSVFTLRGQIAVAQSRLVLVAQNHWHMVSPQHGHAEFYWPLLRGALERGVDIDIVAMHPDVGPRGRIGPHQLPAPDAIGVWSAFMNTPEFPDQIEHCWTTFSEWERWYREEEYLDDTRLGSLRAYGAYFNPMTFTIVDPDRDDGFAILSPRTSDPRSASRPQYLVRKQENREGFNYYWSTVENALSDDHWVKFVG
jgi:hypothetical protein